MYKNSSNFLVTQIFQPSYFCSLISEINELLGPVSKDSRICFDDTDLKNIKRSVSSCCAPVLTIQARIPESWKNVEKTYLQLKNQSMDGGSHDLDPQRNLFKFFWSVVDTGQSNSCVVCNNFSTARIPLKLIIMICWLFHVFKAQFLKFGSNYIFPNSHI